MDSFGSILDLALGENLRRQQEMESNRSTYFPRAWLIEYGTVRLSIGRRTGKTTAIRYRASSSDLVIHWDSRTAQWFSTETIQRPKSISIQSLEGYNDKLRGLRFDKVWVDNASFLKTQQLDLVYETAVLAGARQVILLG